MRDEKGYIVVEIIGCFLLFVLLNFSILTLVNVTVVQARIHYALTQAAETVSMYCYALDCMGAAEHLTNMAGKAERTEAEINGFKTNINGVMNGIESLGSGAISNGLNEIGEHGEAAVNQAAGWVDDISSDPKAVLQNLASLTLDKGLSELFEKMVRPLVGRYLTNGGIPGDQFLRDFHVIDGLDGLEFANAMAVFDPDHMGTTDSSLLTSSGNVKIVVQYEIEYGFGALPLPFNTLKVTQEVMTKAWLDGRGEGYKP